MTLKKLWLKLWRDECGELTYISIILMYTILGIGAIVGLVSIRNQVIQEFGDLAIAMDQLNQSYSVDYTAAGCSDYSYVDTPEFSPSFAAPDDPSGSPPAGISLTETNSSEAGGAISNTPGE